MIKITTSMPQRYRDATPEDLAERIATAKASLGERLLILGHHYQMDEVMAFADVRGDSFGLSRIAAERSDADLIVFCGVHFMAESADILTGDDQRVVLPDLSAGCSMADMADIAQVEAAWAQLSQVTDVARIMPITYMNSTAAIKAFVGRHGGAVCTSSNAHAVLRWALEPDDAGRARADKVMFLPDQHLGRNTAVELGHELGAMALWDPALALGGLDERQVKEATFLLWKGHCSVHQRFEVSQIESFRSANPEGVVVVHPECSHEVVLAADASGSTDAIIRFVDATEPGTAIGIGTEVHLVKRLADEYPDRAISCLDTEVCPCVTMSRIDAAHLCWVLEEALEGRIRNQITVDEETATWALVALERMLAIT
jgi:quinolinate synthase